MATQSAPGVHEAVLSLLSYCGSGLLLDLGCGEGELTRQIASLGHFQVTAIDRRVDPGIPGVRFHECDVEAGWNLTESFDVVVCTELIEHLRNPWTFLERVAAALRPGGSLILSTPNIEGMASRFLFLRRGRFLNFSDVDLRESGHVHPLGYWQLEHILAMSGMQIGDVRTTPYAPVVRTLRDRIFLFLCAIATRTLRPPLPGNILVLRARKEIRVPEAA